VYLCVYTYIHTLHYITLHYITLHTLHYIALHCITLHYITLHYCTLHYITLHYITLHTYIHTYIFRFCSLRNHATKLGCITFLPSSPIQGHGSVFGDRQPEVAEGSCIGTGFDARKCLWHSLLVLALRTPTTWNPPGPCISAVSVKCDHSWHTNQWIKVAYMYEFKSLSWST